MSTDPPTWAAAFFTGIPRFTGAGMPRLGGSDHEVLLGADEKHLAYRASVFVGAFAEGLTVTVSTVVRLHSRAGRAYFAVVRRFHPFLVRFLLRRAALRLVGEPSPFVPAPG